jgi:hypothetical protein
MRMLLVIVPPFHGEHASRTLEERNTTVAGVCLWDRQLVAGYHSSIRYTQHHGKAAGNLPQTRAWLCCWSQGADAHSRMCALFWFARMFELQLLVAMLPMTDCLLCFLWVQLLSGSAGC